MMCPCMLFVRLFVLVRSPVDKSWCSNVLCVGGTSNMSGLPAVMKEVEKKKKKGRCRIEKQDSK